MVRNSVMEHDLSLTLSVSGRGQGSSPSPYKQSPDRSRGSETSKLRNCYLLSANHSLRATF
jgi:hypothetical protein